MFIIDVPTIDGEWKQVGTFDSKTEAIRFIRENIGNCDDEGNINLITEIDD